MRRKSKIGGTEGRNETNNTKPERRNKRELKVL